MTFCIFFALAAYYDLDIEQIDIMTAFFNRVVKEMIYIQIPTRFTIPRMVCLLERVLYRLKQSSQFWYEKLSGFFLEKLGLTRLHSDHGSFATKKELKRPIVGLFVDNLNILSLKKTGHIQRVRDKLKVGFKIVEMGLISYYLGLKVEKIESKTLLSSFNLLTLINCSQTWTPHS